ncbi:HtaA domain-containing protein [Streptomyces sp. NPDC015242]|uniref:HtaA domain-containing protein n=1 Tax=Streptomyces sp. NPDC015242 TaxID=3364951 RepID=UPI0036F6B06C
MPARPPALLTLFCAALLGVAGAVLPASGAHAASRAVEGGRLDWGVKSSFSAYVTGPVAGGGYSLTGGAATVGRSGFRFHSATGTYDGGSGAFRASFSGGVRFLGHRTETGEHRLDLTLSRPTVSVTGSTGTLFVDVTSKAKGTGTVTTSRQVPFASLALGGIDMRGGGTSVVLQNVPATLTAQGAGSFAGYYTAGTALDPVSLSVDVRQAAAKSPTPAAPSPSATRKSTPRGAVQDGAVDWGVRRTFREYVTGDIADGRWTLSSGALDGGALFRFPGGKGRYEDGGLEASFRGAVRFTGAHGLDLRLSAVRVTVDGGTGTLFADVTSPRYRARKVPLVTFAAGDQERSGGLLRVTEAPARLTAQGARAFGGMYRAGTAMDPVSLAVALTAGAALPALPDLGSEPTASAPPTPTPARASAEPVASDAADGGTRALPVALAAGCLAAAAAAVTVVTVRRRRTRPAAEAPDAP